MLGDRLKIIKDKKWLVEDVIYDIADEIERLKDIQADIYDYYESESAKRWFIDRGFTETEVEKIAQLAFNAEWELGQIEKILESVLRELKEAEREQV